MQLPYVLFTTVEEYRRFGAGAPPHMTLTHYTEFADSKGLVLVRGDVINHVVTTVPEVGHLVKRNGRRGRQWHPAFGGRALRQWRVWSGACALPQGGSWGAHSQ